MHSRLTALLGVQVDAARLAKLLQPYTVKGNVASAQMRAVAASLLQACLARIPIAQLDLAYLSAAGAPPSP